MSDDVSEWERVARVAGLDRAINLFPDDVIAAATQARALREAVRMLLEPDSTVGQPTRKPRHDRNP